MALDQDIIELINLAVAVNVGRKHTLFIKT